MRLGAKLVIRFSSLLLLPVVCVAQMQGGRIACTPTCFPSPTNRILDPVNGNDSNSSNCPSNIQNKIIGGTASADSGCAILTTAHLKAMLAAGDTWLIVNSGSIKNQTGICASGATNAGLTLATIGPSSAGNAFFDPTVDISGAVPDGSGGYSTTATVGTQGCARGDPGNMVVIENVSGVVQMLNCVSSQALVDATAGTFYFALANNDCSYTAGATGGTATLYFHPFNISDTVSYSSQYEAINLFDGTTVPAPHVYNITARAGYGNNGTIVLGVGSSATGIEADFGGKHNVLSQNGSTILSSTFRGGKNNIFINYTTLANGSTSTFSNITVDGSESGVGVTPQAFYQHRGGGALGPINLTNWTVSNVSLGIGGEGSLTINGLTCLTAVTDCIVAPSALTSAAANVNSAATSRDISTGGAGAVLACTNCALNGSGYSYISGAGSALTLVNSSLGVSSYLYGANGATITTGGGNIFNGIYSIFDSDGATTITADNNIFCAGSGANTHPGAISAASQTVVQWQGRGYDIHSTFGATCP
jgi:hypothetical protein